MTFNPKDLQTKTGRAKLEPRPRGDAYFNVLEKGQAIGYRPSKGEGDGTWVARYRDKDTNKLITKSVGRYDSYDAAVKAARALFEIAEKGVDVRVRHRVKDACTAYCQHLEALRPRAAKESRDRFERHVYFSADADRSEAPPDDPRRWFGDIELAKLKRAQVEKWFATISKTRAASTANREFRSLRAAFNYALDMRMVSDDHAWKISVHSNAERARVGAYLTKSERKAIIEAIDEKEFKAFCIFLALTGLRPGAAAALKVKDFDAREQLLAINHDKAGGGRVIQLSDKVTPVLKAVVKGQDANEFLFRVTIQVRAKQPMPDGEKMEWSIVPWRKDLWKDRFEKARKIAAKKIRLAGGEGAEASAARIEGATLYSLRHSSLTDMIEGGLPTYSVAKTVGTSLEMIEKYYGHLSQKTRDILNSLGY